MCCSVFVGCASINHDPNILLSEPYHHIQFSSEYATNKKPKDVIEVTLNGEQANILNTVPALYDKLVERYGDKEKILISNISFTNFTERVVVRESYQECKSVAQSGYNGQTTYTQKCETKFRNVPKVILHQKAVVSVY